MCAVVHYRQCMKQCALRLYSTVN